MIWQKEIAIPECSRGFHLITALVEKELMPLPETGILHVFIRHSSAGLTLNENADPTVRSDMQEWQGIYLCEFRNYGGSRRVVLTITS